jgi:hypothetical protein
MKKSELIEALNDAVRAENASALAIRNMMSTFTWSGLPEAKRRQVVDSLRALADGPEQRGRRIRQMVERLQRSEKDVL